MDKEIIYIKNILSESNFGLTTSEISKEIFIKYNYKISKTIVKNYLWSFLRNDIEYDTESFKYKLIEFQNIYEDIEIVKDDKAVRALSYVVEGNLIKLKYRSDLNIDLLLKVLAILNIKGYNQKYDLVKNINRYIDLL